MKKIFIAILVLTFCLFAISFAGCNKNDSDDANDKVDVTFLDRNGAVIQISQITVGKALQMPKNMKDLDVGNETLRFVGWDNVDTEEIENLTEIKEVTQNITLKAVYSSSKNYYVRFYVDGVETLNYKSGAIFSAPVPEKEGYEFEGWYGEDTFETKIEVHYSRFRFLQEDRILYAKFVKIS